MVYFIVLAASLFGFGSAAAQDWPKFHNDLQNTGYSTSTAPNTNNILWAYNLRWDAYSPVVVNGKIYVSGGDSLYCLDAATGAFIWGYEDGCYCPTVADGKLYLGCGWIKCLDADNGNLIWTSDDCGLWWPGMAVTSGKVYAGDASEDGTVWCLDASTGDSVWCYDGITGWIDAAPAISDGKVYIASRYSGGGYVYCLNALTGDLIWNQETTGDVICSSPVVANSRVYLADNWYVYCMDAANGNILWQEYHVGDIFNTVAINSGRIYYGCTDSRLYCLDAFTGNELWHYSVGDHILYSSPAIADNKVFVGSQDYNVYCLNYQNGDLIWSYTTGFEIESSPCVADGIVYIGSADDWIRAFGAALSSYTLTIRDDPNGSTVPSEGTHTYSSGSLVEVTAIPAAEYSFDYWYYDGYNKVYDNPISVTMNQHHSLQAVYLPNYDLTVTTSEGGTTVPAPGIHSYPAGTAVDVTAQPETGYLFDYWELDGQNVGSENPYTVTMNSDHTLHAVFIPSYTLTITAGTGGTTSPSPGTYTHPVGASVEVTASPGGNYNFDYWELDGYNVGDENPYTVLMDGDHTLHAEFIPVYTLTISTTEGGTTDPAPGEHDYEDGTTAWVEAIPDEGYDFSHWEKDGGYAGSDNPYSVYMGANHTLHSVFATHGLGITGGGASDYVVAQGQSVDIVVTVANQGGFPEAAVVVAYYDDIPIDSITIEYLAAGEDTTVTFSWNTLGIPSGEYLVTAEVFIIPLEKNTEKNPFVIGVIQIFICGDCNSDGPINILDITFLINYLYKNGGPPAVMDGADVNSDGAINILDITYLIAFLYKDGPAPTCP